MESLTIKGGKPLRGSIYLSGAKNSALKIIHAAMYSNQDVVLTNVPNIPLIQADLDILKEMGAQVEWEGGNKLTLNGSTLNTYEIPFESGSKNRTIALLAGPLLYRFGKARIPKPDALKIGQRPINRLVDTWQSLGVEVTEDEKFFHLTAGKLAGTHIHFKISTHIGTDNAIISSIGVNGDTIIANAAEEPEVDDLIEFCKMMGAEVVRTDPNRIKVVGKTVFRGGNFRIQNDRNEAVLFTVAALVTKGNISISGVERGPILPFLSFLTKVGCRYEFSGNEMQIWYGGEILKATNINTSPSPGFMAEWQPLATLLLTQCTGESIVHDTVYTDRFGYTKDLNRMGAKIELLQPSTLDIAPVISDDQYDFRKHGEPYTVARITGPTQLKGVSVHVPDLRAGATLLVAALAAEGETEFYGYENISRGFESLKEKFNSLGASIEE